MPQILVMLRSTDTEYSPAELLFGSVPLLAGPDLPLPTGLSSTASSSHVLSMAEAALRIGDFSECSRLISRAMRRFLEEGRSLTAQEWLLLAGLSLLNGDHESCEHRLNMATRSLQRIPTASTRDLLHQRITIIKALKLGLSAPDDGLQEILEVFRFLAVRRCPELCHQAMEVRNVLLKWQSSEFITVVSSAQSGAITLPLTHRRKGLANPEWN